MSKATIKFSAIKTPISPDLFGIFFEDLNYAADGGLYAELIQNRSFEYQASEQPTWNSLSFWELAQRGDAKAMWAISDASPVHPHNPHYVYVRTFEVGDGVGLINTGFDGIPVKAGETYDLSFFARQTYMNQAWAADSGIEGRPMPVVVPPGERRRDGARRNNAADRRQTIGGATGPRSFRIGPIPGRASCFCSRPTACWRWTRYRSFPAAPSVIVGMVCERISPRRSPTLSRVSSASRAAVLHTATAWATSTGGKTLSVRSSNEKGNATSGGIIRVLAWATSNTSSSARTSAPSRCLWCPPGCLARTRITRPDSVNSAFRWRTCRRSSRRCST